MTATIPTTTPAAAVSVAIPDLLDAAAPCVSGAGRLDVGIHLHVMFRRVVAGRLGLDLASDHGHRQAVMLADAMVEVVAQHLLFHGQHPHPNATKTVADWLIGRPLVEVRDKIRDAAAWWRSHETPGRLL